VPVKNTGCTTVLQYLAVKVSQAAVQASSNTFSGHTFVIGCQAHVQTALRRLQGVNSTSMLFLSISLTARAHQNMYQCVCMAECFDEFALSAHLYC